MLSRQSLPVLERTAEQVAAIERGAYILLEPEGEPELIIIATGSEVAVAVETARQLNGDGRCVRVVSMPSTDAFDSQPQEYREQVLPPACRRRIAIEAGIPDYWRKYVGLEGRILGVPTFGESAPGSAVFEHFGINAEGLMRLVQEV